MIFSSALCYCHNMGIRHPSSRRHHFLGKRQVDWHQILVTVTYAPFCFSKFNFFYSIGPKEYKFQTTSLLKVRTIFTPKIYAYFWGGYLPKLLKELWNLEFLANSFVLFFSSACVYTADQILWKATYPPYLQTIFSFFKIFNFQIFTNFFWFVFVNMGP